MSELRREGVAVPQITEVRSGLDITDTCVGSLTDAVADGLIFFSRDSFRRGCACRVCEGLPRP